MKKQSLILFLFFIIVLPLTAQYRTKPLSDNIKTLQVVIAGENQYSLPIIDLNEMKQLTISFDELSHDLHNYYYMIEHCNADWTPSSVSPLEFANGFTTDIAITDAQMSMNTTVNYTHYTFTIPNEDIQLKISGNYAVSIYEDSNRDNKLAVVCFSVIDSKISIDAQIRGNTDNDIRGKSQQLDFTIFPGSYKINNPLSELKVVVQQNGRYDNQVTNILPTYTAANKFSYINNKSLIFEGGNEYLSFDISSIYAYGEGVNNVRFYDPYYHAELFADKIDAYANYLYYQEVNGKYVINIQEQQDDDIWADYILVHFTLPTEKPFFDGHIYLIGGLNYNILNDNVRMNYNSALKAYEKTVLLKQGGYNYLYGFVKKGTTTASTQPIRNSHWETENEYAIYVYHRGFGDRYDKLIGVRVLQSGK